MRTSWGGQGGSRSTKQHVRQASGKSAALPASLVSKPFDGGGVVSGCRRPQRLTQQQRLDVQNAMWKSKEVIFSAASV